MALLSKIESILFVASKPLTEKKLATTLGVSEEKIKDTLETIKMKFNQEGSGIYLLWSENSVQLSTNPQNAEEVSQFVKNEIVGELTKAQLETLTVIAYRSPISKPEVEQIRGVNCAVILRNLLVRGLVSEYDDKEKIMPVYTLSTAALAHLGITSVQDLPDYQNLSTHQNIEYTLDQ